VLVAVGVADGRTVVPDAARTVTEAAGVSSLSSP
jgi:hypothetical protein